MILLPNTDLQGSITICENISLKIMELAIPHRGSSASNSITISMGVHCLIPSAKINPYTLIDKSDDALYLAKKEGRNCFRYSVDLE